MAALRKWHWYAGGKPLCGNKKAAGYAAHETYGVNCRMCKRRLLAARVHDNATIETKSPMRWVTNIEIMARAWIFTLECGHIAVRRRWPSGLAPKRCHCLDCGKEHEVVKGVLK